MKIIKLHTELGQLIKKAKRNDRRAQYELYQRFAPKMLSLCRMYINDIQFAEDVLSKAFVKVFKKMSSFKGPEEAFFSWMRQIVIREAIDFLRKLKGLEFPTDDFSMMEQVNETEDSVGISQSEIQHFLDELREGYRTVFVLHVIEQYPHQSIADLLNISVGTSKSQLYKAKKMLKEKMNHSQNRFL